MVVRILILIVSILSFSLINLTYVYAELKGKSDSKKMVLSLNQCIKKAIDISPEVGEASFEVDKYKSKKMQADATAFPQLELKAFTSLSPEARGDQISSPNSLYDYKLNGIYGQLDILLVQPIYTFGKISSYKKAASSGVKAFEAGVKKKSAEIALRTIQIYYGLLLARETKNLLLEIKDSLLTSIDKIKKQIEIGSPWADEINLYKMNTFLGELNRNLNEAEKGAALAKDALMTSIGIPDNVDFDIAARSLSPSPSEIIGINKYIVKSTQLRPEFIQLEEGLKAREALIDAEKSDYYPTFFLGFIGSLRGATNRDRITNPFVYDPLSYSFAGVFLGLKWTTDFGITKGKVSEAKAEYHKLTEKKRFANEGIPLQVRKAYLELEEARKNIIETEDAYKNAKKWLVTSIANLDLGVGEAKEVADSAIAYATVKANFFRSLYNHRMSYANLLYASGIDLEGIK